MTKSLWRWDFFLAHFKTVFPFRPLLSSLVKLPFIHFKWSCYRWPLRFSPFSSLKDFWDSVVCCERHMTQSAPRGVSTLIANSARRREPTPTDGSNENPLGLRFFHSQPSRGKPKTFSLSFGIHFLYFAHHQAGCITKRGARHSSCKLHCKKYPPQLMIFPLTFAVKKVPGTCKSIFGK